MNCKKIGIFFMLMFFIEKMFAYNYTKNFYDYRGENVYRVCATDTAFTTTYHVVQINEFNTCISRCFILPDKESVMNLYQVLSRTNTATLEEIIRSTQWKFWFQAKNGWLFYEDEGLY